MKSIWVYSDAHSRRCRVCQRYRIWAIEALREKWLSCYIDFDRVVFKLTSRNNNNRSRANINGEIKTIPTVVRINNKQKKHDCFVDKLVSNNNSNNNNNNNKVTFFCVKSIYLINTYCVLSFDTSNKIVCMGGISLTCTRGLASVRLEGRSLSISLHSD